MGLRDLESTWYDPPARICKEAGGIDAVREQLLSEILCPRRRRFFNELKAEVVGGNEGTVETWLDGRDRQKQAILSRADEAYVERYGEKPRRPLAAVFVAHLRCALEAIRLRRRQQTHQHWLSQPPAGGVATRLATAAAEAGLSAATCWDLVAEFCDGRLPPGDRTTLAAFAVVPASRARDGARDEDAPDSAVLGQFRFERIGPMVAGATGGGRGEAYLTPQQAFLGMEDGFYDAVFHDAQMAALRLLEAAKLPAPGFNFRVRLEQTDPPPDPEAGPDAALMGEPLWGRSASAAALRGMYFAFTGRVPNPEVLVLAQAGGDGSIEPVAGVRAKARRATRFGLFDTLVVTGAENHEAATEGIADEGGADRVRVIDLGSPPEEDESAPANRG